jgi:NADPH:quinone reductase-like Zn-dependent oxidoreductase
VLVLGTGGVSIFALQLAQILGARVVVVSGSDAKLARARALGAWKMVNHKTTPEWGRAVRALTGGVGVDLVVEVGGAGTLEQSLAALRFGGRLCLVGNLAGGRSEINLVPIFMRQIRVQGIFVGSREDFEAMNRAIEAHGMRPPISRAFALDETREALEYLANAAHFAKVAIRIG